MSAFDEGVVVQTGGRRAPGASLSSIALAANASQDIELTEQTHGAFGLTGHELDYQVANEDIRRANGTLRNGRVDIQLFDLQPGPWTFTVDRLVGGATRKPSPHPAPGCCYCSRPAHDRLPRRPAGPRDPPDPPA